MANAEIVSPSRSALVTGIVEGAGLVRAFIASSFRSKPWRYFSMSDVCIGLCFSCRGLVIENAEIASFSGFAFGADEEGPGSCAVGRKLSSSSEGFTPFSTDSCFYKSPHISKLILV